MAAIAIAIVVMTSAVACSSSPAPTFRGIVIDPPRSVADVSLPDVSDHGRPFPFRAAKGHLLLVYFGYTNCPDVCPTTLSDLRRARRDPALAGDASRIDLAMATVDPTRDTGALLTSYLHSFDPRAHALRTADADQLARAAKPLAVEYSVTKGADGQEEVSHTGFVYVIDDRARLVAQWSFPTATADYVNDLQILLAGKPLKSS